MVPLSGSLDVASLTPPAHEKAPCLVAPRFISVNVNEC